MPSPGFEPKPYGTVVSVANHYTGWPKFEKLKRNCREQKHPGVDLSRCKDHVVLWIHRIAGSHLRKVVRNSVPEKAYMRRDP
ncbi:UNVERIFIED_CONTAM: hypothetical protein NCL1_35568 [Trichonephila clavipes]